MSAAPPKADIERHFWNVRFGSQADILCIPIDLHQMSAVSFGYIRKAALVIRPDNREVGHVSAYPHSNRWIGGSGAWGDEWAGAGEILGSQSIRNRCHGTV